MRIEDKIGGVESSFIEQVGGFHVLMSEVDGEMREIRENGSRELPMTRITTGTEDVD